MAYEYAEEKVNVTRDYATVRRYERLTQVGDGIRRRRCARDDVTMLRCLEAQSGVAMPRRSVCVRQMMLVNDARRACGAKSVYVTQWWCYDRCHTRWDSRRGAHSEARVYTPIWRV